MARTLTWPESITISPNITDRVFDTFTVAVVCRTSTAESYGSIMAAQTSAPATQMRFDWISNPVYYSELGGSCYTNFATAADDLWVLAGMTRGTGAGGVVPNFHEYKFSANTWTQSAATGGSINQGSAVGASGTFSLGKHLSESKWWAGQIAAAMYIPRQMTDSEFRQLPSGLWAHKYSGEVGAIIVEFAPGGRDMISSTSLREHSRQRGRQTAIEGTTTRFAGAGPPGFRYSAHVRRR